MDHSMSAWDSYHSTVSFYPAAAAGFDPTQFQHQGDVAFGSPLADVQLDVPSSNGRYRSPVDGVGEEGSYPDGRVEVVPTGSSTFAGPETLRAGGLKVVHQSLQSMLTTAERLTASLALRGELEAGKQVSELDGSRSSGAVGIASARSASLATMLTATQLAPGMAGLVGDSVPSAASSEQPQRQQQERPGSGAQARGPLEALRDELFGGFALGTALAPAPTPVPGPAPAPAPAPASVPMLAIGMPAIVPAAVSRRQTIERAPASPPFSPARLRKLPLTHGSPVSPARGPGLAGPSSAFANGRQGSHGSSVAWLTSPTPSMRASYAHPLGDEHSTLHSVAEMSSIYSMPESALNAAVSHTPMSFTTGVVSELDTPSSSRSNDDYFRPGSARYSPSKNYTGYDEFPHVAPNSWTSLRERYNAAPTQVGAQGDGTAAAAAVAAAGAATAVGGASDATPVGDGYAAAAMAAILGGGAAPLPTLSELKPLVLPPWDSAPIPSGDGGEALPTFRDGVQARAGVSVSTGGGVSPGGGSPPGGGRLLSFGLGSMQPSSAATNGQHAQLPSALEPASAGSSPVSPAAAAHNSAAAVTHVAAQPHGGASAGGRSIGASVGAGTVVGMSPGRRVLTAALGGSDADATDGAQPSGSSLTFVNPLFAVDDSEGSSLLADALRGTSSSGGGGDSGARPALPHAGSVSVPVPEQRQSIGTVDSGPRVLDSRPASVAGTGSRPHSGPQAAFFRQQSWGSSTAPTPVAALGSSAAVAPSAPADAGSLSRPAPANGVVTTQAVEQDPRSVPATAGARPPTPQQPSTLRASVADAALHSPRTPLPAEPSRGTATSGGGVPSTGGGTAGDMASAGGASGLSSMSAAVVGSVPQQDRAERVRSWAQQEADFESPPQGSGSVGGAAMQGLSSTGGSVAWGSPSHSHGGAALELRSTSRGLSPLGNSSGLAEANGPAAQQEAEAALQQAEVLPDTHVPGKAHADTLPQQAAEAEAQAAVGNSLETLLLRVLQGLSAARGSEPGAGPEEGDRVRSDPHEAASAPPSADQQIAGKEQGEGSNLVVDGFRPRSTASIASADANGPALEPSPTTAGVDTVSVLLPNCNATASAGGASVGDEELRHTAPGPDSDTPLAGLELDMLLRELNQKGTGHEADGGLQVAVSQLVAALASTAPGSQSRTRLGSHGPVEAVVGTGAPDMALAAAPGGGIASLAQLVPAAAAVEAGVEAGEAAMGVEGTKWSGVSEAKGSTPGQQQETEFAIQGPGVEPISLRQGFEAPPAAELAAPSALPLPQLLPQAFPTPRATIQPQPQPEPQPQPQQHPTQQHAPALPRQPSLSSNPSWASLDSEAATERMKAKTRAFLARVEAGKRQAQGQGRGHSQDTSATGAAPAPSYPTSILAAGRASRASSGSTRLRVQFRTPEVRDSHGGATSPAPALADMSVGEEAYAEQVQPVVIPSLVGTGDGGGRVGAAGLWLGHAEAERSVGELQLHMQDVEEERDTSPGDAAWSGLHKVQAGQQQEVEEQQQHHQQHSPPGLADAGMVEVLQRIRQMVLGAAVLTEPAQSSTAAGSLSFRDSVASVALSSGMEQHSGEAAGGGDEATSRPMAGPPDRTAGSYSPSANAPGAVWGGSGASRTLQPHGLPGSGPAWGGQAEAATPPRALVIRSELGVAGYPAVPLQQQQQQQLRGGEESQGVGSYAAMYAVAGSPGQRQGQVQGPASRSAGQGAVAGHGSGVRPGGVSGVMEMVAQAAAMRERLDAVSAAQQQQQQGRPQYAPRQQQQPQQQQPQLGLAVEQVQSAQSQYIPQGYRSDVVPRQQQTEQAQPPEQSHHAQPQLQQQQAVDWAQALQAKLLPHDAVQQRGTDYQYASAHATTGGPDRPASAKPLPRQQSHSRPSSRNPSPSLPHNAARGRGGSSGSAVASSGGPALAPGPLLTAPTTSAARRGSSPARPTPAASGTHGPTAAGPGSVVTPPAAAAGGPRSPRGGAASRTGTSILDRAGPAAAAAAATGSSTSPSRRVAAQLTEPIAIQRPFAWQERETRHWLEDLGLMPSPAEECAALLDNPLRNGLLLVALAGRLAGAPVPPHHVTDPPRDVRSARTNILCALDHLGLLAQPWADPKGAEEQRRAEAAAAELADAAARVGGAGGGRGRSPSPSRQAGSSAAYGSSGIIAIKSLGSAGRGYALRLKDRQLRAGLGLVSEVEAVLAGSPDSVWGLLNLVRLVCGPQALQGAGGRSGSAGRVRGAEAANRTFDVRGGPGVNGATAPGPAPGAAVSPAPTAAAPGSRSPSPHKGAASRQPSPARTTGSAPAVTATATARSGVSLASAAASWAGGSPARRPGQVAGGPLDVQQQAVLAARGAVRVAGGPTADPRGSLASLLQAHGTATVAAAAASSSGGVGGGGAAEGAAGLLYRPLWPRLAALPYSADELAALEASLLRWLVESGAISRREAAEGFTSLLSMFEDGTFVCWLVSNLAGSPIRGAHRRPLTEAARRTNWLRALEALRSMPRMSRRFLMYEEALVHGDRPVLTGLLEDLHRLATGAPTPPSTLLPDAKPYLPYAVPEPAVHTLAPEDLAINQAGGGPGWGSGAMRPDAGVRAGRGGSPPRRIAWQQQQQHVAELQQDMLPVPRSSSPTPTRHVVPPGGLEAAALSVFTTPQVAAGAMAAGARARPLSADRMAAARSGRQGPAGGLGVGPEGGVEAMVLLEQQYAAAVAAAEGYHLHSLPQQHGGGGGAAADRAGGVQGGRPRSSSTSSAMLRRHAAGAAVSGPGAGHGVSAASLITSRMVTPPKAGAGVGAGHSVMSVAPSYPTATWALDNLLAGQQGRGQQQERRVAWGDERDAGVYGGAQEVGGGGGGDGVRRLRLVPAPR